MNESIFCGRGKQSQYGIKASICLDDIPQEHITTANNGKRYVNIDINEKKSVDQYGYTHAIKVNTWKRDETRTDAPATHDQLPF